MKVRTNKSRLDVVVSESRVDRIGECFKAMMVDVGMISRATVKQFTTYAVYFCPENEDYCFFEIDNSDRIFGVKLVHKAQALHKLPIMTKVEVQNMLAEMAAKKI